MTGAMTRFSAAALGVALLVPGHAALASSHFPDIAWVDTDPPVYVHTTGDITRTWTWACYDPDSDYPIAVRCRVTDVTTGEHVVDTECDSTTGSDTPCATDADCSVPGEACVNFNSSADPNRRCTRQYTPTLAVCADDGDCSGGEACVNFGSAAAPEMRCGVSVTHTFTIPADKLLTDHKYFFTAQCVDDTGNRRTQSRWFWYDDLEPDITVASCPATLVASASVDFDLRCSDTSMGYDFSGLSSPYDPYCSLTCALRNQDTGLLARNAGPCGSPNRVSTPDQTLTHTYGTLSSGRYCLEVYGTDRVGWESPTDDSCCFEVNVTLPDTELTGTPPPVDNDTTPTFDFECNKSGCTFECELRGPTGAIIASGPCDSGDTFDIPADGTYTFTVLATDSLGNEDTDPNGTTVSTYTWKVDTVPPVAEIAAGCETVPSADGTPEFEFTCDDGADPSLPCTYHCLVIQGATVVHDGPCTTPQEFTLGADGEYSLTVTATDAAGNAQASGAAAGTCEWELDTTAPDTALTATPPALATTRRAVFEFTCDDEPCTFECRLLDSAGAVVYEVPCESGDSFDVPADGRYRFEVLATDEAGNSDEDPNETTVSWYEWDVDANAPNPPIITSPTDDSESTKCTFTITGTAEPGATVILSVDGEELARVTVDDNGDWSYELQEEECLEDRCKSGDDPPYEITAVAVDAVGNPSEATPIDLFVCHDSDDDGLPDALETGGGNPTDPLDPDTDGDGLCDGPLSVAGVCEGGEDMNVNGIVDDTETDPNEWDTDGGGVSDGDEVLTNGTDPLFGEDDDCLSPTDCDGDGLDNDSERNIYGTDWKNADSDGDGLTDGDEISTHGTDPNNPDSDGDGLSDGTEVLGEVGTDPLLADTDEDGLCDGFAPEGADLDALGCEHGEDVNLDGVVNGVETNPTLWDTDSGGVDDGSEWRRGSDPLDPDDDFPLLLAGTGVLACDGGGAGGSGDAGGLLLALAALVMVRRRRRHRAA